MSFKHYPEVLQLTVATAKKAGVTVTPSMCFKSWLSKDDIDPISNWSLKDEERYTAIHNLDLAILEFEDGTFSFWPKIKSEDEAYNCYYTFAVNLKTVAKIHTDLKNFETGPSGLGVVK